MAKAKLNPVLQELYGSVGDMVFRRTRNGGVSVIRKADMSNVKWSPAQEANRMRFRLAVAMARGAMMDPNRKAEYEKTATKAGKRAIEVAISDALKKLKQENQ